MLKMVKLPAAFAFLLSRKWGEILLLGGKICFFCCISGLSCCFLHLLQILYINKFYTVSKSVISIAK